MKVLASALDPKNLRPKLDPRGGRSGRARGTEPNVPSIMNHMQASGYLFGVISLSTLCDWKHAKHISHLSSAFPGLSRPE